MTTAYSQTQTVAPRVGIGGFSMMEILVTLALVAVSLLGTAGLLVNSLKVNQSALSRGNAVFLLGDIAERMEANRMGAQAGEYNVGGATISASTNCATSACTAKQLATYDIAQWQQMLTLLPGATTRIDLVGAAANPATYDITITWTDRRTSKTNYADAGDLEQLSLTTRKQIYCVTGGATPC